MNDKDDLQSDAYRSLLLMSELEKNEPVSQREIAGRLGIAVGLVNSYLKTLVHKGFVQVKAYPRNRYAYLLTPKGFAEKSRLAYEQVAYFHKLFHTARRDSSALFRRLHAEGISQVSFCGVDEFTEIAYLSLAEFGLKLVAVYDDLQAGSMFLRFPISPFADINGGVPIVITSFRHADSCREYLLSAGIAPDVVHGPIFGVYEEG